MLVTFVLSTCLHCPARKGWKIGQLSQVLGLVLVLLWPRNCHVMIWTSLQLDADFSITRNPKLFSRQHLSSCCWYSNHWWPKKDTGFYTRGWQCKIFGPKCCCGSPIKTTGYSARRVWVCLCSKCHCTTHASQRIFHEIELQQGKDNSPWNRSC